MPTDKQQIMLDILAERGPTKVTTLIALARTSHATGHRTIARLVEQGLIDKCRTKGMYSLPSIKNPEEVWIYSYLREKWAEGHTARTVAQAFRDTHAYRWPEELVAETLAKAEKDGLLFLLMNRKGVPTYTVNHKAQPETLADLLS
jgi:predicted transcriptional regulator